MSNRVGDSLTIAVQPNSQAVILYARQLDTLELAVTTGKKSRAVTYGLGGFLVVGLLSAVGTPASGSSGCNQGFTICGKGVGFVLGGVFGYVLGFWPA